MSRDFDVIVVGGGAMGTAAARSLVLRGRNTLLLERFRFGHDRGSSGGPTRIFRLTYEHPEYVRMARKALALWRGLEDAAGEMLLATTGGIDIGRRTRRSAEALVESGESCEYLSVEAATERWPAIKLEPGAEILFQEDGGVLMAERTVRAQARLVASAGGTVLEETKVERLVAAGDRVEVRAAGESYRAPAAVVTAGAWAGPLLADAGIELPLVPSLEQVSYFSLRDASPLPTVIDWVEDRRMIPYAVPNPEQPGAVKVALYRVGPDVSPDDRHLEPNPAGIARVTQWAAARFSQAIPAASTETCFYTNTPDEDFVLDRVGPIVIGSPCSGHGFKFAPLVGEILAALATGEQPPVSLESFSASRSFAERRLDYHARPSKPR